jgi:hypothetical protein
MYQEWKTKYPWLEKTFQAYGAYDQLVSLSPEVTEENRRKLADRYGLPPAKFVTVRDFFGFEALLRNHDA